MAIEKLENLIQEYLDASEQVLQNQKLFSGVFGFGGGLRTDSCHDVFLAKLEEALKDEDLDPYEVVKFLIYADQRNDCHQSVKCMLTAIQGLSMPFLSKLNDEQAKEFYEYYKSIPRYMRLPVQDQIFKELRKRV